MLRAILAHHSSHSDDSAAENAGDATEEDHLPKLLAEAEECAGEGHAEEGDHERWFSPESIGCLSFRQRFSSFPSIIHSSLQHFNTLTLQALLTRPSQPPS